MPCCRSGCSLTKHAERVRQALTGKQSGVGAGRLAGRRDRGRRRLRRRAPGDPDPATPATVAGRISNAGAVFVGPFSPVSLGDYCAGSNHVLPTGGSRPVLRRAVRDDVPASDAGDRLLARTRSRRWRRTCWRCPPPRTCPRTARPLPPGSAPESCDDRGVRDDRRRGDAGRSAAARATWSASRPTARRSWTCR